MCIFAIPLTYYKYVNLEILKKMINFTKNYNMKEYNVWFIADPHINHKNILRHQPNRIKVMGLKDNDDIDGHDKYIIDMWLEMTQRGDHVYVLGDFILSSRDSAVRILHKLKSKGCKIHLIVGNHDKATQKLDNLFESIDLIKVVDFKKSAHSFLEEDLPVVMCHYPMITWPRKAHGALHLFGHIHANSPWIDKGITEGDLMLNVGLDAELAGYKLINLKDIYKWYQEKLNGMKPVDFIDKMTNKIPNFVR